jgi:sulfur transfer protein SufE
VRFRKKILTQKATIANMMQKLAVLMSWQSGCGRACRNTELSSRKLERMPATQKEERREPILGCRSDVRVVRLLVLAADASYYCASVAFIVGELPLPDTKERVLESRFDSHLHQVSPAG